MDMVKYIRMILQEWQTRNGTPIAIGRFHGAGKLLQSAVAHPFDIVFLDILMPLISGINAARELRCQDPAVRIVFLTSSAEFAIDGCSVRATDYLLKPMSAEQLCAVMDRCAEELKAEPKNILLKTTVGYRKIRLSDIESLEAFNKQVILHLTDGSGVKFCEPLHNFDNLLTMEDGLCKCRRLLLRYTDNPPECMGSVRYNSRYR